MGKVYLAEQKMGTATRKVAIKTLHPELSNDAQLVARFHRESETVIELRHPNTIQFYDFGELDDATLIIVMEYIQGKPLATVLEEDGAIDPARVEKIIIQACGSLHEAHQRGIVQWPAAVVFYLIYVAAILVLCVLPAVEKQSLTRAIGTGALFGLAAYAAFDLTALALLKGFPLQGALVDLAWGTVLTGSVSAAGYLIARALAAQRWPAPRRRP